MASPAVTYTFANSTTADATQVNQNFTDLINGITDGTKDLSISALTCAGTATLNGNVALGNSSSDTLTINAVLSSSLAMGTTFAYDFGSATVGLKSIYLGSNDSAARSVRVIAPAVTASYTITVPPATASQAGMGIVTDASSVWTYRYPEKTTAKTTTYTATGDETTILCDATSAAFTVTLPAAASFTGKHFYIKKTDSDISKAVTVDGNASETIDGATTTTLNTQYECIKIVSDGSNWHILNRDYPKGWAACTITPAAGFGTVTNGSYFGRRVGDSLHVRGYFKCGTVAASAASFDITGYSVDTAKIQGAGKANLGAWETMASGAAYGSGNRVGPVFWNSGTSTFNLSGSGSTDTFGITNVSALATTGDGVSFEFSIPVSGWK